MENRIYIKTFESIKSEKFNNWFEGSKVINDDGSPRIVYHGTDYIFSKFSMKKAVSGITWFSTDLNQIKNGESGAAGNKYIKKIYISMKNPAGWSEYEKYGLGQLEDLGYDGVILPNDNGNYVGFVFHTNQIRIVN
jgi:hypothetical protein